MIQCHGVKVSIINMSWFLTAKQQQIRIKQNEYLRYYNHSKQNSIKG